MAAAGHPIVAVAPEIAVVAFAVVHVGRGIDYVCVLVSLVLRRQVESGNHGSTVANIGNGASHPKSCGRFRKSKMSLKVGR